MNLEFKQRNNNNNIRPFLADNDDALRYNASLKSLVRRTNIKNEMQIYTLVTSKKKDDYLSQVLAYFYNIFIPVNRDALLILQ